MHLVNQDRLNHYLYRDVVTGWLDSHSRESDEELVCNKWLRQTPAKRFIFDELYGDLIGATHPQRVLDVGGGLSGLTRELATRHRYVLADLLVHGGAMSAKRISEETGVDFARVQDWATLEAEEYDLVVANDLFPNVDQRLELFLQTFLPRTRCLRLSLTYYEEPRSYMTRRLDADEILCVLAWDSSHLRSVLQKYAGAIVNADFDVFLAPVASVFENRRQVCLIEFSGGLAARQVP